MANMELATSEKSGTVVGASSDDSASGAGIAAESIDETPNEWESLASLDAGTECLVKRIAPEYAEGWLGAVELDGNGPSGVIERIRAAHGGGTFLLQPRARAANGKRLFSGGSMRLKIAGFPIVDGARCGPNGPIAAAVPAAPQHHMAPMGYPMPYPPTPPDNGMQAQLMGLVGTALKKGDASIDLAGVIGALQGLGVTSQAQPARQLDPFAEVKKTLELTALLKAQAGDDERLPPEKADPMEKLMQLAMMKMMSGGDSAPMGRPPAPKPRRPPAQRPTQSQSQQYGPPTPQPSPNHVWHPARGWVVWSGAPEAQRDQPPAGPSATPSSADGGDDPADDYVDPITPAELVGELEHRSQAERVEFIRETLGAAFRDPEMQSAFMEGLSQLEGDDPDSDDGADDGIVPESEPE